MPTYYSDIFTGAGRTDASTKSPYNSISIVQGGSVRKQHARTRTSIAHLLIDADEDFLATDVAHMIMLKPTDCLVDLEVIADAGGGTATLDVGLYTATVADGTYVFTLDDADFFATDLVFGAGAITRTSVLQESNTVTNGYVGAPLWEVANLAGAKTDYTANFADNFVISLGGATANTTADNIDVIVIATYVAGD